MKVIVGDKTVHVDRIRLTHNVLWGWRRGRKIRLAFLAAGYWEAGKRTVAEIEIKP
jgi:hypothetical protein